MKALGGLARMIAAGGILAVVASGCASADRWSSDTWQYNATSGYPAVGMGTGGALATVSQPASSPGETAPWPSASAPALQFDTYTDYPYAEPGSP
jgi:hypothetical protein